VSNDFLFAVVRVEMRRLHRHPCESCGKRRVLFTLTVNGVIQGNRVCAVCAGVR
jgi:hypothetical protein